MPSCDVEVSMDPRRGGPSLRDHLIDFANMLKAFIGCNYLTIAYAFRQSGLALGLAGLVVIATLTAHCCQLLVKCKYQVIRRVLSHHRSNSRAQGRGFHEQSVNSEDLMVSCTSSDSDTDDDDEAEVYDAIRKKLQQNMNYGDIGQLCIGKVGLTLVNVSVMITQFGFCVGYFIFIGNTLQSMFPLYNCSVAITNSSMLTAASGGAQHCIVVKHLNSLNAVHVDLANMTETLPGVLQNKRIPSENLVHKRMLSGEPQGFPTTTSATVSSFITFLGSGNVSVVHTSNDSSAVKTTTVADITTSSIGSTETPTSDTATASSTMTAVNTTITTAAPSATAVTDLTAADSNTTTVFPNISTTTSVPWANLTRWILTRGKHVPDLKVLVLSPILILIGFTLIRSLRQLGFISFVANASIFIGCVEVLAFLVSGFSLSSSFRWMDWKDMPIFFGMVTSSFEGIGTILPIESSMEGNRHNFVKFLYGAIAGLTMVLACFGVLGYLSFGNDVEQMINANIPNGQWLSIAVNSCLCVGVLLTFPLMMYPVVDLAELNLFGNGRLCGPKAEQERPTDHQSLLPKKEIATLLPVAEKVSESVPTWKRNCLRIFVVSCAGGLAVLLRNNFAYISAFVGALGSTMLAYILPCLFHLKLRWQALPLAIKVKDITIIIIGICCGAAGVYSVLLQIISNVE